MRFYIKEIREEIGMSQQELADKSKVSRTIISNLENNNSAITSTRVLSSIAAALGKKVSEIFLDE